MADKLTNLYREGKINKYEFDTYLLFAADDKGRAYLQNMLENIILEEPVIGKADTYMKAEGRRSVWRQIMLVINKIEDMMEGNQHDNGNDSYRNNEPQPLHTFYPPNQ